MLLRGFIAVSGLLTALLLVLAAAYLRSPPGALDLLDRLFLSERGVRRAASGIPYGADARQTLDVWIPAGPATPRPVLVFFYGGGWRDGSRRDYGFVARAFAARGYVVVLPDYRLVPAVRFPAFNQDGAAAVRWAYDHIARFGGDPGRIVLAGHSAGAYIAVMLALDPRYLRDAGADPHIVRAVAGLSGPYDFYPWDSPLAVDAMSHWPDPHATQPIHFARAAAPPLLLATGSADTVVRPRNAYRLADRERASGNRSTQVRDYAGLNHNDVVMALSRPFRRRAPVLDDVTAFFHAALKQDGSARLH